MVMDAFRNSATRGCGKAPIVPDTGSPARVERDVKAIEPDTGRVLWWWVFSAPNQLRPSPPDARIESPGRRQGCA